MLIERFLKEGHPGQKLPLILILCRVFPGVPQFCIHWRAFYKCYPVGGSIHHFFPVRPEDRENSEGVGTPGKESSVG
jgi:hypothetical protein